MQKLKGKGKQIMLAIAAILLVMGVVCGVVLNINTKHVSNETPIKVKVLGITENVTSGSTATGQENGEKTEEGEEVKGTDGETTEISKIGAKEPEKAVVTVNGVNYASKNHTIRLELDGTDNDKVVNSTLAVSQIVVKVNGTALNPQPTKSFESGPTAQDDGKNTQKYVLALTNVTGDGQLSISIPANTLTDQTGNQNDEITSTFDTQVIMDNTAPAAPTITNSSNGQWSNQTITINMSATDPLSAIDTHSGVAKYQIKYSGSSNQWTDYKTGANASDTWSEERNETIYIRAVDNVGNIGAESSTDVKIDTSAPTLSLSLSTDGYAESIDVNVTANGTGSNIAAEKWLKGNHAVADFASAGTPISNNTFNVTENGIYTVYVADEAGNSIVSTIEVTKIDKTAPTIIANDQYNGGNVSFTAEDIAPDANEAPSGVVGYQITNSSTEPTSGWINVDVPEVQTVDGKQQTSTIITPPGVTAGTHYIWVIDAAGHKTSKQISVTYTITFNSMGAETPGTTSVTVTEPALPNINIPLHIGYTFKGYYLNILDNSTKYYKNDGTPAKEYDLTSDVTLIARWEENSIIFDDQIINKTYTTEVESFNVVAASNGTGSYKYEEVSEKKNGISTNYITITQAGAATIAAGTPAGQYSYEIKATDLGSGKFTTATYNVVIAKADNSIAVTDNQSWSEQFATIAKTKSITAASDAQGTVTYTIQSQKDKDSANVEYFSLSGTTLTRAANTPVNQSNYTVVIRATAAGNDNYNSGYKDITMTVTVTKANGSGSVTMANWTYGDTPNDPVPVSSTNGTDNVSYQYKLSTAADSTYSNNKPSDAGTYTVKATFPASDNYNGFSTTGGFTINKKELTVPGQSGTLTYNGSAQTPSWDSNYNSDYMNVSVTSQINAGTYNNTNNKAATFSLKNLNTIWSDGTTADKTVDWTIFPKALTSTEITAHSVTYSGGTEFTRNNVATGVGSEKVNLKYTSGAANVGTYTFTTSSSPSSTQFKLEITSSNSDNYTIASAGNLTIGSYGELEVPAQSGTLIYNGSAQSPSWDSNYNTTYMNVSVTSQTNAGTYSATFSLKDANTTWSDGTKTNKTVNWTISPKALTSTEITAYSVTYNGGKTFTRNNVATGIGTEKVNLSYTAYSANVGTYAYATSSASGKYTLAITSTNKDNYSIASAGDLTIDAKTFDVPSQSGNLTYNGNTQYPSWDSAYNSTYMTVSDNSGINANTYTATFGLSNANTTWKDGTTANKTVNWTINPKALTSTEITAYSAEYTGGTEFIRTGVATGVGVETVDLKYTSGSANVGTYTFTTSSSPNASQFKLEINPSNSNYTIASAGSFDITKRPVQATGNDYSDAYDGNAHSITVTVTEPTSECTIYYKEGTELTASNYNTVGSTTNPTYTNLTNGDKIIYWYVHTTNSNYSDKKGSNIVNIGKTKAIAPTITSYEGQYDGGNHGLTVTGGSGGTIKYSTDNSTWSTVAPTETNFTNGPITIYVKVFGDSNHSNSDTVTGTINILPKELTSTQITSYSSNYTGGTTFARLNVATGVGTEKIGLAYTTGSANVGTYTFTTSSSPSASQFKLTINPANSNYTITSAGDFTIDSIPITVTRSDYSGTYDADSHSITVTVTEPTSGYTIYYKEGIQLTANNYLSTGTTTNPTFTNWTNGAKTVYWYITAPNHISKSGSNTVTINKKALTSTEISAYSVTYNGGTTFTRNGVATGVAGETVNLTYTANTATAGTYSFATSLAENKFTLSQSNTNYSITSAGDFTIKPLKLNVPEQTGSLTYNGNSQSPTLNSTYNSTYMTFSASETDAGEYMSTVSLKNTTNTQWSDGTTEDKYVYWVINPKALTSTEITAYSAEYTGGTEFIRTGVATGVGVETVDLKYTSGSANVRTSYTFTTSSSPSSTQFKLQITSSNSGNYTIASAANFTITKRPVQATGIGYSGGYDGSAHGITVTVTEPTSGCTIYYNKYVQLTSSNYSSAKATTTNSNSADATYTDLTNGPKPVYWYVHTTNSNYSDISGTNTVDIVSTPAPTPNVTDYSGTYDGAGHGLTVIGVSGGTLKYSRDNSTWSTDAPTETNFTNGPKTIYVKVEGDSNHSDSEVVTGTINITKKSITVTADNNSKIYGDENPTFTATVGSTGITGETGAITGSPACTATETSNVGSYAITRGTVALADNRDFKADNYSMSFVNGTLTINKKTLTVPAQSGTLTYNGTAQTPSWDSNYDSNYMNVSVTSRTNAGSSSTSFSLKDKINTQWSDGTRSNKSVSWTINPKALTSSQITAYSVSYNGGTSFTRNNVSTGVGNEKVNLTYTTNAAGVGSYYYEATSGNSFTLSQTNENYTITSASKLTISAKLITPPTATHKPYTGSLQTSFTAGTGYTVTNNTGTEAGLYNGTAVLSDKTNTRWSDTQSSADKTLPWYITYIDGPDTVYVNTSSKPVDLTVTGTGILSISDEPAAATATASISGNTLTITGVAEGPTTTVKVKESLANYEKTINIVVDTIAPKINYVSTTIKNTNQLKFNVSAIDSNGIIGYWVINSSEIKQGTVIGGTDNVSSTDQFTLTSNTGWYSNEYIVVVMDAAGNINQRDIDRYLIEDENGLKGLAACVDNDGTCAGRLIYQNNDIDASSGITCIGGSSKSFSGTYDGGNHRISDIKYSSRN